MVITIITIINYGVAGIFFLRYQAFTDLTVVLLHW